MSTRGFVGYRTEKGGEIFGHYNHSDSYPTGLGADLARVVNLFSNKAERVKKYFSERYTLTRGITAEKYYHNHKHFIDLFSVRRTSPIWSK